MRIFYEESFKFQRYNVGNDNNNNNNITQFDIIKNVDYYLWIFRTI